MEAGLSDLSESWRILLLFRQSDLMETDLSDLSESWRIL
jgi:hypothetical protein